MKRRTWTTDDQLTSDLVHTRSLWRVMDCVVNWKKRLYKINRRKLFVYGLHNQLNIAVCDDASSSSTFRPNHPFSSSDGDGNSSVKDGVALDGQVTLLAYRYRESGISSSSFARRLKTLSSTSTSTVLSTTTLTSSSKDKMTGYHSNDVTPPSDVRNKQVTSYDVIKNDGVRTELSGDVSASCASCLEERRKPFKRIYSHSDEFGYIYKKINWQDWTMDDQPHNSNNMTRKETFKQRKVEEQEEKEMQEKQDGEKEEKEKKPQGEELKIRKAKAPQSDLFVSTHHEISLQRLSRLYLDYDSDSEGDDGENSPINTTTTTTPHLNSHKQQQQQQQHQTSYKKLTDQHQYNHTNSCYTDSLKSIRSTETRGSFRSCSSGSIRSTAGSPRVPMNFIPGQLKARSSKEKLSKIPLFGDIQKVIFCFKGITCRVEKSQPRTSKAIVHTGMMFLSMSAPSAHKCTV